MLKTVMLVSALALSAPSLAQDMTPAQNGVQDVQQTTEADKKAKRDKAAAADNAAATEAASTDAAAASDATMPTDAAAAATAAPPAGDVSADVAVATQTAPAPAADSAATPANVAQAPQAASPGDAARVQSADNAVPAGAPAGTPVTGKEQIAQVVNTEFPTYDKNTDGNLDKTEFSAWMVALKSASDPSTNAAAPETTQWVDGAFAQADKDKSAAVSKDELTSFLTQGAG